VRSLFPAINPYQTHTLAVTPPHRLYIEECGNPSGLPVLFLHGGPGGSCSAFDRRFFDPEIYRIILFDQRGCGRSTPLACTENNTTQDLIQDIEAIRQLLNIKNWVVFGGSWGSTLGLAYAQAHPDRVKAMVLRGVFLGSAEESRWIFQAGMSQFFPDKYHDYQTFIAPKKQHDLIGAYNELLKGDDDIACANAAKRWATWESACAAISPQTLIEPSEENRHHILGIATLECHYMKHDCFLAKNQLLDNMKTIAHIPSIIVQGRQDLICRPLFAWQLHLAWPGSCITFVPAAGHTARESGIATALVYAANTIAQQCQVG
jgi:proline iminopeptidase